MEQKEPVKTGHIQMELRYCYLRNAWCDLLPHLRRNRCRSDLVNGSCDCCTLWNACGISFIVRRSCCWWRRRRISCFRHGLLQWNPKKTIISSTENKKHHIYLIKNHSKCIISSCIHIFMHKNSLVLFDDIRWISN